ncbi:heavy metal sensor histidine kinase [Alteromonas sp. NFXS44]
MFKWWKSNHYSISARQAVIFASAAILIVSMYALTLRYTLHDAIRTQMHQELTFREKLVLPTIMDYADEGRWDALNYELERISAIEGHRVQYWVKPTMQTFSEAPELPNNVVWENLPIGYSKVSVSEDICSLYLLNTELTLSSGNTKLELLVAIDSTPYMGTFDSFNQKMFFLTLFGACLVALLGYVISRAGMKPVNALSIQSGKIEPGVNGQRLDTKVLPLELQPLGASFNGVLERQEVAWQQLESFNANVAHELKTPLTNLIGQTQLAISKRRSREDLEELLYSNLEELDRLTRIVNDMLFLSRSQSGQTPLLKEPVDLTVEANKIIEYLEPNFTADALRVNCTGSGKAQVDRGLFHRALGNLLENAIQYAEPDSTILIHIEVNAGQASISVTNTGETIDDTVKASLFDRFFRADPSRNGSSARHGLGLSIVKAIATLHGGNAFVSSTKQQNTFGFSINC